MIIYGSLPTNHFRLCFHLTSHRSVFAESAIMTRQKKVRITTAHKFRTFQVLNLFVVKATTTATGGVCLFIAKVRDAERSRRHMASKKVNSGCENRNEGLWNCLPSNRQVVVVHCCSTSQISSANTSSVSRDVYFFAISVSASERDN